MFITNMTWTSHHLKVDSTIITIYLYRQCSIIPLFKRRFLSEEENDISELLRSLSVPLSQLVHTDFEHHIILYIFF